jgi:RNA polymerase sigma factor (sigma-70 family)
VPSNVTGYVIGLRGADRLIVVLEPLISKSMAFAWIGPCPASRDPTPSRELARREREAALLAALERLPGPYRDVVIWHHREQLAFEEIGRRRGISAEAARKLWARALARLRQELGREHATP